MKRRVKTIAISGRDWMRRVDLLDNNDGKKLWAWEHQ
jgi:hypothetical protein